MIGKVDCSAFNDEAEFEIALKCANKMEYEHRLRFIHRCKGYQNPSEKLKKIIYMQKRFISPGRRFGKTRLNSIMCAKEISEELYKATVEFWQKVDRGEI